MNTCPKCGSPQESPKLDGTTARIWFTCGSYGYADKPDQVFRSSDKCLDREEKNTLQRKVEELQVALDFANEAVDQRERSRKETEAKLDDLQASTKRETLYAVNDASCKTVAHVAVDENGKDPIEPGYKPKPLPTEN